MALEHRQNAIQCLNERKQVLKLLYQVFSPSCQQRWLPWILISLDIFYFFWNCSNDFNKTWQDKKIVAAFWGMDVSPVKHSFWKCDRKVGQTDRQMDGQSDPYVSLCFAGYTKSKYSTSPTKFMLLLGKQWKLVVLWTSYIQIFYLAYLPFPYS